MNNIISFSQHGLGDYVQYLGSTWVITSISFDTYYGFEYDLRSGNTTVVHIHESQIREVHGFVIL